MNKCIGVPNLSRDHWVQCGGWSASPNPENLYSLQTRIQQVNDAKGAREKVPIASRSHGWKKRNGNRSRPSDSWNVCSLGEWSSYETTEGNCLFPRHHWRLRFPWQVSGGRNAGSNVQQASLMSQVPNPLDKSQPKATLKRRPSPSSAASPSQPPTTRPCWPCWPCWLAFQGAICNPPARTDLQGKNGREQRL